MCSYIVGQWSSCLCYNGWIRVILLSRAIQYLAPDHVAKMICWPDIMTSTDCQVALPCIWLLKVVLLIVFESCSPGVLIAFRLTHQGIFLVSFGAFLFECYNFSKRACVEFLILLIWFRRIPYTVALRHHHGECATLLNPSSAEPLVWPSPLKFISELNHEAKALLERALMDANKEREKVIGKGTIHPLPSALVSSSGIDDDASEVIMHCP